MKQGITIISYISYNQCYKLCKRSAIPLQVGTDSILYVKLFTSQVYYYVQLLGCHSMHLKNTFLSNCNYCIYVLFIFFYKTTFNQIILSLCRDTDGGLFYWLKDLTLVLVLCRNMQLMKKVISRIRFLAGDNNGTLRKAFSFALTVLSGIQVVFMP